MNLPEVGVIVPSVGTWRRAPFLRRALESVLAQEGVQAIPVVVFNGPEIQAELVKETQRIPRVRTLVLDEAGLPAALLAGRRLVEQPWFAELDDDDELLPGALLLRVRTLEALSNCGAVVTNGIRRDRSGDALHVADMKVVEADPLRQLLEQNWLLPGSWLCSAEAVAESAFVGMPRYLECTFLAARLATVTRLAFLQEPTVVYNVDTPASESKSSSYLLGHEAALQRILELDLPPDVRRGFELRLAWACWAAALLLAETGHLRAAYARWLRGLRQPRGWRYLPGAPLLLWARRR